jgi:hypothetical protein
MGYLLHKFHIMNTDDVRSAHNSYCNRCCCACEALFGG